MYIRKLGIPLQAPVFLFFVFFCVFFFCFVFLFFVFFHKCGLRGYTFHVHAFLMDRHFAMRYFCSKCCVTY